MDKMTFTVYYRQNDKLVQNKFESFAAAAGHAEALTDVTRFIDVTFSSGPGLSHSGTMYCYSNVTNTRRICNQYMIDQVMKLTLFSKGDK